MINRCNTYLFQPLEVDLSNKKSATFNEMTLTISASSIFIIQKGRKYQNSNELFNFKYRIYVKKLGVLRKLFTKMHSLASGNSMIIRKGNILWRFYRIVIDRIESTFSKSISENSWIALIGLCKIRSLNYLNMF